MGHDLLREAADFFQHNKGYRRLLEGFAEKYRSLDRLGGTVRLDGLSEDEREALGLLLRRDFSRRHSVTVSYEQFELALEASRFRGVDVLALLQACLGTELISKRKARQRFERSWEAFASDMLRWCAKYGNAAGERWLRHLAERGKGARNVVSWFETDAEHLHRVLKAVLRGIALLPSGAYERLPLFAFRVTKDPHAFDRDRVEGKLLLQALVFLRQEQDETYRPQLPLNAEESAELLYHFGILRDDILNFVTCSGIVAVRAGRAIPWWEEAAGESAVLHVPLREIVRADEFLPVSSVHGDLPRIVWIVENSGVFAELLDRLAALGQGGTPAVMCTRGQFHLAVLHLMDRLAASGCQMFYSGDFDPEGLLLAQKLCRRYPGRLKLWRYSLQDYEACLSDVDLSESRIRQLEAVDEAELIPVRRKMQHIRKAGYQEQLAERLAEDVGEWTLHNY